MRLHQAYYTSCHSGWGAPGFQFNALSPELNRALLTRLTDLCRYEPPPSLPSTPTTEEIAGFPVNLFYQPLADGTMVLGREVYVGKGFDGRYGNFFAHLLLADAGELEDLRPIELWNSPTWVNTPSETRDLPEAEALVRQDEILKPGALEAWASTAERAAYLPAFFAAVEEALVKGRRIVIVEAESTFVARWVALASLALPPALVAALSFCTYHKDPERSGALLIGTTADSWFEFNPQQMRFQYFVLDFVKQRFSQPGNAGRWGVAAYEAWKEAGVAGLENLARQLHALLPTVTPVEIGDLSRLARRDFHEIGQGENTLTLLRCCGRLGPEQWSAPQDLAEVFRQTTSGRAGQEEFTMAAAQVHRFVTENYPPHSEAARYFWHAFAEWVAVDGCRDASTASLIGLVALVVPSSSALTALHRTEWLAALERAAAHDPARLVALLRLGEALGWLDLPAEARAALAGNFGRIAGEAGVCALLRDQSESGLQTVLLQALVDALGRMPPEQVTPAAVSELLRNDSVAYAVSELTETQQNFPAAARVTLERVVNEPSRVGQLRACLAAAMQMVGGRPLAVELIPLDFVYQLIWRSAPLDFREAVDLLELAKNQPGHPPLPKNAPVIQASTRAFVAHLQIESEKRPADSEKMLERFAMLTAELGIHLPAAQALAVRAQLRRLPFFGRSGEAQTTSSNSENLGQVIEQGLALSSEPNLPQGLRQELLDLSARGLVNVPSWDEQAKALEKAAMRPRPWRDDFRRAYGHEAYAALRRSPPASSLAALLFGSWRKLGALRSRDLPRPGIIGRLLCLLPKRERTNALRLREWSTQFLRGPLRRALLHWSPTDRAAILRYLGANSALAMEWKDWEKLNCPKGVGRWLALGGDLLSGALRFGRKT